MNAFYWNKGVKLLCEKFIRKFLYFYIWISICTYTGNLQISVNFNHVNHENRFLRNYIPWVYIVEVEEMPNFVKNSLCMDKEALSFPSAIPSLPLDNSEIR